MPHSEGVHRIYRDRIVTTYTVTNSALGARGVGRKLIEPGFSGEIELTEYEAVLLNELSGVEVSELKDTKPAPARTPAKAPAKK